MVGLYPLRVPGKPRFILVFLKMFSFHSYPKTAQFSIAIRGTGRFPGNDRLLLSVSSCRSIQTESTEIWEER